MRVLISGGAGFLGSHLCDYLISQGHEVVALDNLITGKIENIAHLNGHERFKFIRHDVSNYIYVPGKLDAVMHFASPASPNPSSPLGYPNLPIQTMKAGALGTHNTLGLALANNARFMLASTSEIYGDPQVHPQKEDYWGHVDPIGERSVYDEAKRFAEALTMAYHRFHGVNSCIVRIFNTYGPRMQIDDGRAVANFILQALAGKELTIYGDGQQTRSFCYVDDLVKGIYKLLISDEHNPVNIGNPQEITIENFAQEIGKLVGKRSSLIFEAEKRFSGDPQRRQPDISRAKKVLSWEPEISLTDGLTKTIDYFRQEIKKQ